MRKTPCPALAAVAILLLTAPAREATAMPLTSSAAIHAAGNISNAATAARYQRHKHHWAWRPTRWYPRHYWYAAPLPYPHYDILDSYWGNFWYDPGRY